MEAGIARGESAQKDKEINSIKGEKKKWMWWLIGILMAEGIGAGIYAYTKFSNPIGLIKKL